MFSRVIMFSCIRGPFRENGPRFLRIAPRYLENQGPFVEIGQMDLEIGPQFGQFGPRFLDLGLPFVQFALPFLGFARIEVRRQEMDLAIGEIDPEFQHTFGNFRQIIGDFWFRDGGNGETLANYPHRPLG